MADVLKQHVMHCPEHPMNAMREALEHVQTMARLALSQGGYDVGNIGRIIEEIRQTADKALTE
jgi:hypothetical protein